MDLNHKNMYLSWALVQLYIFDREIPPVSAQLWRYISYSALWKESREKMLLEPPNPIDTVLLFFLSFNENTINEVEVVIECRLTKFWFFGFGNTPQK